MRPIVAPWIRSRLRYARKHGWTGAVISGWRSRSSQLQAAQEYSRRVGRPLEQLYPAGVYASNHLGLRWPSGAVDVTDPAGLELAMRSWVAEGKPRPLLSRIPGDPGHFSASGR